MLYKIGLDIGYYACKGITTARNIHFPSAVGDRLQHLYTHGRTDGLEDIVFEEPGRFSVGSAAVHYGCCEGTRRDRSWIDSEEYYYLFLAAISELITDTSASIDIVLGLPVSYYKEKDRELLIQRLFGQHAFKRRARATQKLTVTQVRVVPQPIGALMDSCLNGDGDVSDPTTAMSHVGIIDVGGKTTNLLHAYQLRDVPGESISINVGGWRVIDEIRAVLSEKYPNIELRDHEIGEVVRTKTLTYYGNQIDISSEIASASSLLAPETARAISKIWRSSGRIDKILLTGGGSLLIGEALAQEFPQLIRVEDPIFANVRGYWKLSQRTSQ